MQIFLETERLVLRRFTTADAENLFKLDNDPTVMRFITGGKPTLRDEIEKEILPAFLRYYERGDRYGFWAAVEKTSGGFVGWFHFRPPEGGDPDEAELGYRLRRSVWGKGYATEGSRALIHKGFAELGVRRIYAETMAVNTASRRVMEKAGLRYARAFHQRWPDRIEGSEYGDVEYALTRADWKRQEAGPRGSGTRPSSAGAGEGERSMPPLPDAGGARISVGTSRGRRDLMPNRSRDNARTERR